MKWNTIKHILGTALLASAMSMQAATAAPVISAVATPAGAVAGHAVGVDINIAGITDLAAWQFTLNFDPSLLQVVSGIEGSFLDQAGTTFFDAGTFDNAAGTISFAFDSLFGPGPGASGSGLLAHYDFNAVGNGPVAFSFSDLLFLDSASNEILVSISAVPEPATVLLLLLAMGGVMAVRRRGSM
ncbi:MAG: cohesin domain-containing protein [Massilia sp.]